MTDVTNQTEADFPDEEIMPLRKCICGKLYESWAQVISIYPDHITPMPCCGAKLYWVPAWKVMQVDEQKEAA